MVWIQKSLVDIYIYICIYLEPFDDLCFEWSERALFLEGGKNPKIEGIHRFQVCIAVKKGTLVGDKLMDFLENREIIKEKESK